MRLGLLKLLAPICPLLTEKIWQQLRKNKIVKEESVHLSDLPKYDEKRIDKKLEEEFNLAFQIIELGLAERDKAQIGLKWPLACASITCDKEISKQLQEIIVSQLNVKKIELKKGKEISVKLDTKLTPELEAEGYAREISRKVQALRKTSGLVKENLIELVVVVSDDKLRRLVETQRKMIKERTNAKTISIEARAPSKKYKAGASDKVKDKDIGIFFNKL
jgi:isoleucyl-tRNA synthetase